MWEWWRFLPGGRRCDPQDSPNLKPWWHDVSRDSDFPSTQANLRWMGKVPDLLARVTLMFNFRWMAKSTRLEVLPWVAWQEWHPLSVSGRCDKEPEQSFPHKYCDQMLRLSCKDLSAVFNLPSIYNLESYRPQKVLNLFNWGRLCRKLPELIGSQKTDPTESSCVFSAVSFFPWHMQGHPMMTQKRRIQVKNSRAVPRYPWVRRLRRAKSEVHTLNVVRLGVLVWQRQL